MNCLSVLFEVSVTALLLQIKGKSHIDQDIYVFKITSNSIEKGQKDPQ